MSSLTELFVCLFFTKELELKKVQINGHEWPLNL